MEFRIKEQTAAHALQEVMVAPQQDALEHHDKGEIVSPTTICTILNFMDLRMLGNCGSIGIMSSCASIGMSRKTGLTMACHGPDSSRTDTSF